MKKFIIILYLSIFFCGEEEKKRDMESISESFPYLANFFDGLSNYSSCINEWYDNEKNLTEIILNVMTLMRKGVYINYVTIFFMYGQIYSTGNIGESCKFNQINETIKKYIKNDDFKLEEFLTFIFSELKNNSDTIYDKVVEFHENLNNGEKNKSASILGEIFSLGFNLSSNE